MHTTIRTETQLTCFQEDTGIEALGGHALDLENWVETHLGSYLCTSENVSHRTITVDTL
jgi:hypothetical protein